MTKTLFFSFFFEREVCWLYRVDHGSCLDVGERHTTSCDIHDVGWKVKSLGILLSERKIQKVDICGSRGWHRQPVFFFLVFF